ncbi:MAG: helix-turn-helix domain-containing protein [Bacteroidales bacterium]|nr:helix-turn-helix domain-containing protein [Bacteroidales bacterium]
MDAKVLQIESVNAAELLGRLERVETALNELVANTKPATEQPAEFMNRAEVAAYFSITLPTVHTWINKGVLRAYKAGCKTYFKRQEVEEVMTQRRGKYADA